MTRPADPSHDTLDTLDTLDTRSASDTHAMSDTHGAHAGRDRQTAPDKHAVGNGSSGSDERKGSLRTTILARRRRLSPKDSWEGGRQLVAKLDSSILAERIRAARTVAAYLPALGEVSSQPLLDYLQALPQATDGEGTAHETGVTDDDKQGRTTLVPKLRNLRSTHFIGRVANQTGRSAMTRRISLDWAIYQSTDRAERVSSLFPRDPLGPGLGEEALRQADIIFLPALALDADGNRLGHGSGWYDQALVYAAKQAIIVGIIWPWELSEDLLPHASWDLPVSFIASPDGVIPCGRRSDDSAASAVLRPRPTGISPSAS